MKTSEHSPAQEAGFFRKLFISTFLISAFTVGGGYVIIPLLRAKYVEEYGWLNDKETLDLVAIAQSLPGVVAVNACIILGYRMAKFRGALTALLATALPPLITISIIAIFYDAFSKNPLVQHVLKGMQCGATALIVKVAIELFVKQAQKKLVLPLLIAIVTLILNLFFDVNVMILILVDGLIGLLFLQNRKYD